MKLKIAVTGAHGTGKTTLAKRLPMALADYGIVAVCREAARMIATHASDPTFFHRGNNTLVRQSLIFIEQQIEERRQEKSADILVNDRTFIDHLSYTAYLFPDAIHTPEFLALKRLSFESLDSYDLIFQPRIEFPLVGDDVREADVDFQRSIDVQIGALYAEAGRSIIDLSGSVEQRISTVARHVQDLLKPA